MSRLLSNIYFLCFLPFIFILATNRYFSFEDAVTIMGQSDMLSYRAIAHSAPYLPDHEIVYHHAQRAFLPYFSGVLAYFFGLDVDILIAFLNICLLVGTIIIVIKTIDQIEIDNNLKLIFVGLVIFNPYITRYFSVFYYMINDTVFMFGFAMIVYAMVKKSLGTLLTAIVIAALGRQTALLLLPAISLYIYLYHFKENKTISLLAILLSFAFVVGTYFLGGYFASLAGGKNTNSLAITSFFIWLNNFDLHKLKVLLEFYVRGLAGQITIISLFTGWYFATRSSKIDKLSLVIIFLSISVWIQPLLAGPDNAGNNIVRLCIYSFPGLVVALAMNIKKFSSIDIPKNKNKIYFILTILVITSFHHRWSYIGAYLLAESVRFALLTYTLSVVIGVLFYKTISVAKLVDLNKP